VQTEILDLFIHPDQLVTPLFQDFGKILYYPGISTEHLEDLSRAHDLKHTL
jgi:hypothetical protein